MNSFYICFNTLKEQISVDNLVQTITHGVVNDVDIEKKNIFPLVHIAVTGSEYLQGTINYSFSVWCLEIRNISKIPNNDKFWKNDNEIDNLNTTSAILMRLLTRLNNNRFDNDVELVSYTSPEPIEFDFTNILDGWKLDITLSVTNTIDLC